MWKTGGPVFPPNRGLVAGRASDLKTNAMLEKCRYLLWRPLIGNKPKGKEEVARRFICYCNQFNFAKGALGEVLLFLFI